VTEYHVKYTGSPDGKRLIISITWVVLLWRDFATLCAIDSCNIDLFGWRWKTKGFPL